MKDADPTVCVLVLGLVVALLLACAGSSHTRIQSGMYSISCKRNRANCYEEAAAVCPRGFDILDGDSQRGAIVHPMGNSAIVTPTYKGELLVQCRKAKQASER